MPVNPIIPKRNATAGSSTGPNASALQTGELASNAFTGDLYLKREDAVVEKIGSDASKLSTGTMPAGRLPALSGDVASNAGSASVIVTKLQGKAIATTAPASGQFLSWNATLNQWEPVTMVLPSAGGDLSGTLVSATVAKIQGRAVSSTAPSSGQVLKYDGTQWAPATEAGGVTGLTGDVTASGAGNIAATVARIRGVNVSSTAPTSAQVLRYDGTQWAPAAANLHTHAIADVTGLQSALDGKQAAGNYAPLVNGLVPQANLPSYVDDVLEYAGTASFPATGESGKIYVDTSANISYRWTGSQYVAIVSGGVPTGTASGDLSGSYPSPTVAKIRGVAVSSSAPSSGQVLKYDGTQWAPASDTDTGMTALTGDVTASGSGSQAATVARIQGRTVASTAPTSGQVLSWNSTTSQWEPATVTSGSSSLGGDLSGTTSSATVAKIQGRTIATTAPTSGQVLSWNSTSSQWEPATVASGSSSVGGDLSGTTSNATVAKLRGVDISITAPSAGQVLKYNGVAWAPAADTDTGLTALTGDVTASGNGSQAATVARIQGRAVASTAPTASQVLTWNATSSQWEPAAAVASAVAPVLTSFTGNGSTTLFAISGYTNTNVANYLVVVGGVAQKPDSSVYTVSSAGVLFSVAPANGVSGFVLAYQAPTGSSPLGYTAVNKAGDSLTGALNEAQGADIASASTVNLTTATGNYVRITGTTAITGITLAQGAARTVVFAAALTLTNSASLILPSGANITTAAGDSAVFRGEASGVVRCVSYMKASGEALVAASGSSGGGGGIKIFDTVGANQPWTVPAGVTSVVVEITSGGAGGSAQSGGGNGGASSCSIGGVTVTATGGSGSGTGGSVAAVAGYVNAGAGGALEILGTGSGGGYGGNGGSLDGGGGLSPTGYLTAFSRYGIGGPGGQDNGGTQARGGGGGAYAIYQVSVTPGQTYSNAITVGAGGAAGTGSTGTNGYPGQQGRIIIRW
jgi:hypothetical protein